MLKLIISILLTVVCLLSAGCAAVTPAASTTAPPASTERPPIVARAQATPGNFSDLDPSAACQGEYQILLNVYETLTLYNPPGSAEPIRPALATDWQASDDGLTWTFHLRKGVTFHDGAPLDAAAVKFSVERNREKNACSAYLYEAIDSIVAPDPSTVAFHLSYPAPLDLILSSGIGAFIMSPAAAEKEGAWFAEGNELGSGPYRIARYEPGQRMVLERNPDYWGGWQEGQIDRVVYEMVEDPVVGEQMLRAGELDYVYSGFLADEQIISLDKLDSLRLDVAPGLTNELIFLNQRRAPTNNPLVRQALAYSFPYDEAIANTWLGKGTRAHGAVPTTVWGHIPEEAATGHDLDKAKALLAEAGYPDGLTLRFTFDHQQHVTAELWQAALAKIGVDLQLVDLEWTQRWERQRSDPEAAPEAYMIAWPPDVVGPYTYLFNMFHGENEPLFNLGFYDNPAFDALIDEGNVLSGTDRDAAAEKFIAAERMLIEDNAAIFIQDLPDPHIVAADLKGFVNNAAYNNTVFWHEVTR
jgi:peptide/nickel transport system substrate-binding protein